MTLNELLHDAPSAPCPPAEHRVGAEALDCEEMLALLFSICDGCRRSGGRRLQVRRDDRGRLVGMGSGMFYGGDRQNDVFSASIERRAWELVVDPSSPWGIMRAVLFTEDGVVVGAPAAGQSLCVALPLLRLVFDPVHAHLARVELVSGAPMATAHQRFIARGDPLGIEANRSGVPGLVDFRPLVAGITPHLVDDAEISEDPAQPGTLASFGGGGSLLRWIFADVSGLRRRRSARAVAPKRGRRLRPQD